jgi:hypothetical protein
MSSRILVGLMVAFPLLAGCEGDGGGADGASSVPECEQFLRRAEACFAKNPVVKATHAESVNQVKELLKTKPGQPFERAKMVDLCKQKTAALAESCN